VLDGRDTELKNHVGHKVEVTGTLEAHRGMSGRAAPSSTPSGSPSSRMDDSAQHLQVSSVRMIASDCSAK
jgi:hypothetical protein